ncbi:MAG: ATP-binding protein [Halanaeroarchaeum sp.]
MTGSPDAVEPYKSRLEAAMLAGNVAWWEMDVPTGAVSFHERKATMLGHDPEGFAHFEDFTELLHPEDYERAMAAMQAHLDGERERYDVEYRIETAEGDYRWYHDVGGVNERTEEGAPLMVSGLVVDVTERKEYAAELRRRNEQLTLLNRLVRHDIRNDASVALAVLETIEGDAPADLEDHLDRIRSAAENTVATTENVQAELSVLGESEDATGLSVALPDVLDEEVAAVREQYPEATVEAEPVPDVAVRGNAVLSSVFRNLLTNAAKHAGESPTVTVGVDVAADAVTVTVTDDGPGVPDAMKERIFERGEGGDDAGLGLGLYFAKTLTEAFGGEIAVADVEPHGARFSVTVPRP